MASTNYVWNPPVREKATKIPSDFEPTLKAILHAKWVEQDWNISQIIAYLAEHYNITPSKRQLTSRIEKWRIQKKNRSGTSTTIPSCNTDLTTSRASANASGEASLDMSTLCPDNARDDADADSKLWSGWSRSDILALEKQAKCAFLESNDNTLARLPAYPSSEQTCLLAGTHMLPEKLSTAPSSDIWSINTVSSESSAPECLVLDCVEDPEYVLHDDGATHMSTTFASRQTTVSQDVDMKVSGDPFGMSKPWVLQTDYGPDLVFSTSIERMDLLIETASGQRSIDLNVLHMSNQELVALEFIAHVQMCCGWTEHANRYYKLLFHGWLLQHANADASYHGITPFVYMTNMLIRILQTKANSHDDEQFFYCWMTTYQQSGSLDLNCLACFTIVHLALTLLKQGHHQSFERMSPILLTLQAYPAPCIRTDQCKCQNEVKSNTEQLLCNNKSYLVPHGRSRPQNTTLTSEAVQLSLLWMSGQLPLISKMLREEVASDHIWQHAPEPCDLERAEQRLLITYLIRQASRPKGAQGLQLGKYVSDSTPLWIAREWLNDPVPILTLTLLSTMARGKWHDWPAKKEGWQSRRSSGLLKLLESPATTAREFVCLSEQLCGDEMGFNLQNLDKTTGSDQVFLESIRLHVDEGKDKNVQREKYSNHCQNLVSSIARHQALRRLVTEPMTTTGLLDVYDPPWNDTPPSSASGLRSLKSVLRRMSDLSSSASSNYRARLRGSLDGLSSNSFLSPMVRWSRSSLESSKLSSSVLSNDDDMMQIDE